MGSARRGSSRPLVRVNWREAALQRRKVADWQLIVCVVTTGLVIMVSGLTMFLGAWFILGKEDPFILIGPVVCGCGLMVLLMSVETCVRRHKVVQLADELSSDEEDGHYIDESLIPYAFGHFVEQPAPETQDASSGEQPVGELRLETPLRARRACPPAAGAADCLHLSSLSSHNSEEPVQVRPVTSIAGGGAGAGQMSAASDDRMYDASLAAGRAAKDAVAPRRDVGGQW
ncbi:uncharacterized protein LOC119095769 [Pollicipes pollicipes]|uniref:uncharacterized protein LOC119095769 n=1 Tax=Pollicipes pollicipes TaxID=41117 RepID=UPI0018858496|nr:uncharacterized protein LOC119095769 [Pollicipes pollicipes]